MQGGRGVRIKTAISGILIGLLFLVTDVAKSTASTEANCSKHYLNSRPPIITAEKRKAQTKELCFTSFAVMHSGLSRTAFWSAEYLTAANLNQAKQMIRADNFHPEETLSAKERSELKDYRGSGYDRGHLAPNGNMPNEKAQFESFSLCNIIPQNPDNNRNLWEGIESAVRTLAKKRGELYVITGPLFVGKQIQQIGGRVLVPSHMYKVVYDPKAKKGAAYVAENKPGMDYVTLNIAELELKAGINFFPDMPEEIKTAKLDLPKPTPRSRGRR